MNLINITHWGLHSFECCWLTNGLINQDGSIERLDYDKPFSMLSKMPRRITLPFNILSEDEE